MLIQYWSNAYSESHPLVLRVAGRLATLEFGSNADDPEITTLGVFRKELTDSQVEPLIRSVSSAAFLSLPKPEPVPPGEVVRRITITDTSGEVVKYAAGGQPTEQAFDAAERLVLSLVEAVRTSPVSTFSVGIEGEPTYSHGVLEILVHISNTGPEVIYLHDPRVWAEKGVALVLRIVRETADSDDSVVGDQVFVDLEGGDVTAKGLASVSRETIAIPPGGRLLLSLRPKPRLQNGSYELQVALTAPLLSLDGTELILCEAFSLPTRVRL